MMRTPINPKLVIWIHERAGLEARRPARPFFKLFAGELRIANIERFPKDET